MNSATQVKIAQILNVESSDVIEIREWAWVYWVHVAGKRPTMVGKAAVHRFNPVFVLSTHAARAEFVIRPGFVRITYINGDQTEHENTTRPIARRRWKSFTDRGFVRAA